DHKVVGDDREPRDLKQSKVGALLGSAGLIGDARGFERIYGASPLLNLCDFSCCATGGLAISCQRAASEPLRQLTTSNYPLSSSFQVQASTARLYSSSSSGLKNRP